MSLISFALLFGYCLYLFFACYFSLLLPPPIKTKYSIPLLGSSASGPRPQQSQQRRHQRRVPRQLRQRQAAYPSQVQHFRDRCLIPRRRRPLFCLSRRDAADVRGPSNRSAAARSPASERAVCAKATSHASDRISIRTRNSPITWLSKCVEPR
jgi:hypothetical protein